MPQLRLPSRNEAALIALAIIVLLFVSWLRRGEKIATLEAALAAKPRVEFRDRIVEKKVTVRGPVQVVTVIAKDGTKTITANRAGETVTSDKARDLERTETPICPAPYQARTRYVHLAGDAAGPYGGDIGLTLWDRWDVGVTGDWRRQAVGAQVGLRW